MTDTPNLGLPFIEGSQAQKHVTHNEALRILDAAIQIAVRDMTLAAPPADPAEGDRYVVGAGATGDWAGRSGAIATWQDGAWAFLTPKTGWCIWSIADGAMRTFDGTAWQPLSTAFDNIAAVGINTTATGPNLLSVTSNAALFTAIDAADGGTGDVRLQLSKESAAKTASIYFSDNYSGRAEFGLVGSDTFKLKVSADGAAWIEAVTIDQASGTAALPRGLALTGIIAPVQIAADQNDYNPAGIASACVVQVSSDATRAISGLAGGAEGRILSVINIGSQPIVLRDQSASSAATNRFALGGDLTLCARQAALLRYDGTAARWQAMAGGTRRPVVPGHIAGLTLSTAGASATFGVAAGVATDDAYVDTISLAAAISKSTAAWTAGSGQGALDTGSIANATWYHVHLIKRPDTGLVDVLVSLSATSPARPAGYTLSRRIGAMKTDASAKWIKFIQDGDLFTWDVPVTDFSSVSDPGTLAILRPLSVAPDVCPLAIFHSRCSTSTAATAVATIFSDPQRSDTAPDFINAQQIGNTTLSPFANLRIRTNAARQIRVRSNFSDANVAFTLVTEGWVDRRGRA